MDAETRAVIEETVSRTLTSLGIDSANPIETQRDLAALHELRELIEDPETQADLMHLRKWRKAMESVQSGGFRVAVALLVTGVAALLVLGVKSWIGTLNP